MSVPSYGGLDEKSSMAPPTSSGGSEAYIPNKLGIINGVYVPCLLNIMGVILFLRLSWSVGQAGWAGVLGMLLVAETQSILTVLSLSAIASNGKMKGGGSYYIMSRSLGPELGGAMGCLFYTAFSVSAAFYAIGFATEVQSTWFPDNHSRWLITLVSSCALGVLVIVALIGAEAFTKINVPLFVVQFAAIFIGLCSIWFRPSSDEFPGLSSAHLSANTLADFSVDPLCGHQKCTPNVVFGIIFPAATGIMEGANLSGDLADPAKMIGKGTLFAVGTAIVWYATLIITFAAAFPRHTLQGEPIIYQKATASPYIIIVGVLVSSASSCLGAMFGGARILQALGKDNILPGMSFFSKGAVRGNEPRRAVLFTWFVAQCCLFIGNLDVVAPLIASFFCLSYAMTNLACFLLRISGTPNFRPRFKYWTWHTALLGAVLNIGVMFYLNIWYASVSLVLFLAVALYLVFNAPETAWGDVRQAIIFHQVRKYLLHLDPRKRHGKLWRPSILLYVEDLRSPLVDFCNDLKKGGLYILGSVLVGDFEKRSQVFADMQNSWLAYIDELKLKAFPQVSLAPAARTGYQNLLLLSGLGAMTPNTVVVPIIAPHKFETQQQTPRVGRTPKQTIPVPLQTLRKGSRGSLSSYYFALSQNMKHHEYASKFLSSAVSDVVEYVHMLHDILLVDKNLVIAGNFQSSDSSDMLFGRASSVTASREPSPPHSPSEWRKRSTGFRHSKRASPKHGDSKSTDDSITLAVSSDGLVSTQGNPLLARPIDVWLLTPEATSSWENFQMHTLLLTQLALVIHKHKYGVPTMVRVFRVMQTTDADAVEEEEQRLRQFLEDCRVETESVACVPLYADADVSVNGHRRSTTPSSTASATSTAEAKTPLLSADASAASSSSSCGVQLTDRSVFVRLNELMSEFSADAAVIFTELPALPTRNAELPACVQFLRTLDVMTTSLPPICFVRAAQMHGANDAEVNFFSQDI